MSREEAIEQLKQMPIHDGVSDDYRKTIYEAIDIAIKSLEAWELVKKEIKQMRLHYGYIDVQASTIIKVLKIIDKHLVEVEK